MQIQAPLYFLPNLEYFVQILPYPEIYIDQTANFQKQGFTNRSYILGPHTIEKLTIPIDSETKKKPMNEVSISYAENWQRRNWLTIENCYRKSPFFEYYESYFYKVLVGEKFDFIYQLNESVLTLCLKLLSLSKTICHGTSAKQPNFVHTYKKPGEYGAAYMPYPYLQNFGNDFVPNLSIIDVLFCKGPETVAILNKSTPFEHIDAQIRYI